MQTLIEFFDKDAIKNILAVLTIRPDKVIFLYDRELTEMNYFYSLSKCFRKHMPHIVLEKYPVDIMSIDDIYQKTIAVIEENPNCVMELTGGSELMIIAGYKAGSEKGVQMVYTDITKGEMIDLTQKERVWKTSKISLEDFVDAKGACFIGNSHREPETERYGDILKMSNILFENLKAWKNTCSYLQLVVAEYHSDELSIHSKVSVILRNGKYVEPDSNLMYAFLKTKFIKNLNISKKNISFTFTSKAAKQYMINYGVWLELFVYIMAKQSGNFDDVMLGAMIDWNAYDGITVAGNEIDVIISDNSMPVFISCKLREADTAALNELVIAKKRLGGWFSKCIIVTFGNDKTNNTGTYKRAKELGVLMMDKKDIMSKDFSEKLVRIIREHDLVSLKWKKV